MKHKVLLSLLLVLFSVTVAAQQEDKTVSTQDDEKVLQQGYREKVEQQQSVLQDKRGGTEIPSKRDMREIYKFL